MDRSLRHRYLAVRGAQAGGLSPLVAKEQLKAGLAQSQLLQPPAQPAEVDDLYRRGIISAEERTAGRAKIVSGTDARYSRVRSRTNRLAPCLARDVSLGPRNHGPAASLPAPRQPVSRQSASRRGAGRSGVT
jgi:hypothetical protein